MNEQLLNLIKSRRSTRKFTAEPISRANLEVILEAGRWAPSGHNQQSWFFTVISDKAMFAELNQRFRESAQHSSEAFIHKLLAKKDFDIFYHAPVAVLVSAREDAIMTEANCAAATQNMLLTAESLGLGSCWIGFAGFPFINGQGKDLCEKLAVPEGFRPLYAFVLGHKELQIKEVRGPKRKENWVHYHSFSGE